MEGEMQMTAAEADAAIKALLSDEEAARVPEVMTDKSVKFFDPSSYTVQFNHRAFGLPMWILPDGRLVMSRRPHSFIWFAFSRGRQEAMLRKYGKDAVFPHCSLTIQNPFSSRELERDVSKMDGGSIVRELSIQIGLVRMGFINGAIMFAYGLTVTRAQFDSMCDLFDAGRRRWTEFESGMIEQFDGLDSVMSRVYLDESEYELRFLNDIRSSCEIVG